MSSSNLFRQPLDQTTAGEIMTLNYRLALDLGTNSIGWCVLRLDMDAEPSPSPYAIIRGGVRIFGDGRDPKSGSSLAVDRRSARGMRRNRDRSLKRKKRLMNVLTSNGFFPQDREQRLELIHIDPYELRSRGLDEELTQYEFGRAIWHLNQRRGFKSNRKTDGDDNDGSLLKTRIQQVKDELSEDGYRTVGEWLADRAKKRQSVRARLHGTKKADKAYDLYFDRSMIEDEFNKLWATQAYFNSQAWNTAAKDEIYEAIFFQRPLRPVKPGRCRLNPDEERLALAMPSQQRFRILQEVNNLRFRNLDYSMEPLSQDQRDSILSLLLGSQKKTFDQIRRTLKLSSDHKFNLESERRKELKGDSTGTQMANARRFGKAWHDFSLAEQDLIVDKVLNEESEAKLDAWLKEAYGLTDEQAHAVATVKPVQGYGSLGAKALSDIIPFLTHEVVTYDQAVELAGYGSHSQRSHTHLTGEILDELPYYGEILQGHVGFGTGDENDLIDIRLGRIANPTVHIALNQVRKVVNTIIKEYGKPTQITVELARDLPLSTEQKRDLESRYKDNQDRNDRVKQNIAELGLPVNAENITRYKLWQELNHDPAQRHCPYTGEAISAEMLFSNQVEIEHILPYSQTLDDSMNNKTVCVRRANQEKGNRTPHQAFGHNPPGYDYQEILRRSQLMPKNKAYRFAPNGMDRWLREDEDFLARALNDTRYLSRLAREYLQVLTGPDEVWVVPGQLTAKLRHVYGLNNLLHDSSEKNRADHRHHAIDAAVIGVIDRRNLQEFARTNKKMDGHLRIGHDTPTPWHNYREHVARMVHNIKVSHRPNHGHQRQMNNDTNYGLRKDGLVAIRKALDSFDSVAKIEKTNFADPVLKERLLRKLGNPSSKDEFAQRLAEFSAETGTKRARILEKLEVIPIETKEGHEYRAPKGEKAREDNAFRGVKGDSNYCIEIVKNEKGKWVGEIISTYEAYRIAGPDESNVERLHDPKYSQSGKPLVMRLMRDDTVRLEIDGAVRDLRVCFVKSSGVIGLAELNEANVDARTRPGNFGEGKLPESLRLKYFQKTASTLQPLKARQITISPSGRLKDHGFRD